MSAFFVTDDTVHDTVQLYTIQNPQPRGFDDLDELGRAFLLMNCDAILARYPQARGNDEERDMRLAAERYRYTPPQQPMAQLVQSARCLSYQCCEGDIPETRRLYALLDDMISRAGEPEGMDNTEWSRSA